MEGEFIRNNTLPEYIANEIYDILICDLGAPEYPNSRDDFVRAFSDPGDWGAPKEFRFGGTYGLAGKFWWNNGKFYASGWSHGEVDEKTYATQVVHLEVVNNLLANVYERYINPVPDF